MNCEAVRPAWVREVRMWILGSSMNTNVDRTETSTERLLPYGKSHSEKAKADMKAENGSEQEANTRVNTLHTRSN